MARAAKALKTPPVETDPRSADPLPGKTWRDLDAEAREIESLRGITPVSQELPDGLIPNQVINVGLDQLELSDLNVRKTDVELDIEGLADDIAANGLKQNLCVVKLWDPGAAFASYGVVAGSRRFRALRMLAARGTVLDNHPVPVLVEAAETARATSLSENLSRVAMNAADECEAFGAVLGDARDPDALAKCARRFGVSVRKVEERLRLAALSPEILERLRRGTLTLDSAKAYATFPDHALQDKVFKAQEKSSGQSKHAPHAVRDAMRGKVYPADHLWVRYAGTADYLAAGGRIERSMFMGANDADALVDTAIFEKVAMAKANSQAQSIAQGEGFRDGMMMAGFGYPSTPKAPEGFRAQWLDHGALSDEDKAEAIALFSMSAPRDGEPSLLMQNMTFVPVPVADDSDGGDSGGDPDKTQRVPDAEIAGARLARQQRHHALMAWLNETPPEQFVVEDGTAEWGETDHWFEFEDDGSAVVPMMVVVPARVIDAKLAALVAAAAQEAESVDG